MSLDDRRRVADGVRNLLERAAQFIGDLGEGPAKSVQADLVWVVDARSHSGFTEDAVESETSDRTTRDVAREEEPN